MENIIIPNEPINGVAEVWILSLFGMSITWKYSPINLLYFVKKCIMSIDEKKITK